MARHMWQFVESSMAPAVVFVAVLAIISVVGWHVVARFRGLAKEDETPCDLLAEFRELRHRDQLSQAEYRSVKAVLAERLQEELNSSKETG